MARVPLRNLRVDDETWERWQAVALDVEEPVSGFIREAVEERIARLGRPGPPPPRAVVHAPPRNGSRRTEMCEHRRTPDQFCSRCD